VTGELRSQGTGKSAGARTRGHARPGRNRLRQPAYGRHLDLPAPPSPTTGDRLTPGRLPAARRRGNEGQTSSVVRLADVRPLSHVSVLNSAAAGTLKASASRVTCVSEQHRSQLVCRTTVEVEVRPGFQDRAKPKRKSSALLPNHAERSALTRSPPAPPPRPRPSLDGSHRHRKDRVV
jgi:hypothetical protein